MKIGVSSKNKTKVNAVADLVKDYGIFGVAKLLAWM
jgi:hypothetical protein